MEKLTKVRTDLQLHTNSKSCQPASAANHVPVWSCWQDFQAKNGAVPPPVHAGLVGDSISAWKGEILGPVRRPQTQSAASTHSASKQWPLVQTM
eukprot:SAG22_NODE_1762_length_3631_cov_5.724129_5_plen_94_part_00